MRLVGHGAYNSSCDVYAHLCSIKVKCSSIPDQGGATHGSKWVRLHTLKIQSSIQADSDSGLDL